MWGAACLHRDSASRDFDANERQFLADVAPDVGRGLQASLSRRPATRPCSEPPPSSPWIASCASHRRPRRPSSSPGYAWATLFGVAARVYDKDRAARARVRLVDGRWLLLHASCLHISRHTLRDHVKAIFAKVGAKSRSELTALVGGGSAPDLV
jgi:hypothetical protein